MFSALGIYLMSDTYSKVNNYILIITLIITKTFKETIFIPR